jgi:hypothetical protein
MKIIFLLISFVLISSNLFASKYENNLLQSLESMKYSSLEKRLDNLKEKSTKKIEIIWSIELKREIVGSYEEQKIKFEVRTQIKNDPLTIDVTKYYIELINIKDTIIYYKLIEEKYIRENEQWLCKLFTIKEQKNIKALVSLDSYFFKTFKTNLNMSELFIDSIVYGKNCGESGSPPTYRIKLDKVLDKKDISQLKKWLQSATIEIQLYAIEGYYFLKSDGVNFDEEVDQLVKIISTKKGTAYICQGCFHFNETISEIIKRIEKNMIIPPTPQ